MSSDHALPQRVMALSVMGDAPSDEGCEPLISRQDAPARYRVGSIAHRGELPRERFLVRCTKRTSIRRWSMSAIGGRAEVR